MENYGLSTASAVLGDMLVYRNLEPMDPQLPSFAETAVCAGVAGHTVPRKTEPDYARMMVSLLRAARAIDGPHTALRRLLYVGDTRMNDGVAFRNLCQAGGWTGVAFIGSESKEEARTELVTEGDTILYLANRWGMLDAFDRYCGTRSFPIDDATVVILDLDKTMWGARGRNDHVIDEARVEAVRQTVEELLGPAFDTARFEASYSLLNRPEFHPFTSDNQDYLAYICLILGSDLFTLTALVNDIRSGQLAHFAQFMETVEASSTALPKQLQLLHTDIYDRVRDGDATPFKVFRYNEYRTTVGRMGCLDSDACVPALLARELVLTHEVCEVAQRWSQRGALLFGLSDKPDEASLPGRTLAQEGFQPLHRTETHVVGSGFLASPDKITAAGDTAF